MSGYCSYRFIQLSVLIDSPNSICCFSIYFTEGTSLVPTEDATMDEPPDTCSRRAVLTGIVGAPLAGIGVTTSTEKSSRSPGDLLIKSAWLPDAFSPSESQLDSPLVAALRTSHDRFCGLETATNGFWAGADSANPRWVCSSVACVADGPLPIDTAVSVVARWFDQYADAYRSEIGAHASVTTQTESKPGRIEWEVALGTDLPVEFIERTDGEPRFREALVLFPGRFRLVIVSVFAPTQGQWTYDQLLDRLVKNIISHSETGVDQTASVGITDTAEKQLNDM